MARIFISSHARTLRDSIQSAIRWFWYTERQTEREGDSAFHRKCIRYWIASLCDECCTKFVAYMNVYNNVFRFRCMYIHEWIRMNFRFKLLPWYIVVVVVVTAPSTMKTRGKLQSHAICRCRYSYAYLMERASVHITKCTERSSSLSVCLCVRARSPVRYNIEMFVPLTENVEQHYLVAMRESMVKACMDWMAESSIRYYVDHYRYTSPAHRS